MPKLRNQSEILLFSIVAHDPKNKKIIPIGDFLSSGKDSITINCYLTKVIERFSLYSFFTRPKVVVTDYSWANLHALCRSLNDLEIIDYLNLTFNYLIKNDKIAIFPIKTMIYLCSTHFLKNVIEKVNKEMQKQVTDVNFDISKRFIKAFILLQTCQSLPMFCECLKNIKNVFSRKFRDEVYVKSLAALSRDQLEFDIESLLKIEFFERNQNHGKENNRQIFFYKE